MRIKCLIVDDEPPAREVLKRYVEEIPTMEMAGECANAIQAITILQQQSIDLKNPPKIIFTTAYSEYALEGYELDIVDYLMKPIRFDRFLKAVNRAFPILGHKQPADQMPSIDERINESFVYFRADRKMVKVLLNDILYIESMKDYIKVVTTTGTIITKQSISSVETMLPETLFLRTHRSFIVSISKIKSFTNELIDIDKAEIPIGKLYRNGVMKYLS